MASMPNHISTEVMDFDGTKVTKMEPGWIYSSQSYGSFGRFQLGLTHNSTASDVLFMTAVLMHEIVNIESSNGLQFNIDGEKVLLSSNDIFTHFTHEEVSSGVTTEYRRSTKIFVATRELVQALLDAETVKVRLMTHDGFVDGDFKTTKALSAQNGFQAFIDRLSMDQL